MLLSFVFPVLFLCYATLILVYRKGWLMQNNFYSASGFFPHTKISIIIPARNEAENMKACLLSILENDYPSELFEIIVIDDFSTDETALIATSTLCERGKVLSLKNYLKPNERLNSFKKKALSIAIDHADGTLIVTTDADCIVPKLWLKNLVALYQEKNAKFIVAPVIFSRKTESSILYYFQLLDFMTMQGITAAATALKLGNMCNGANLAFDKKTFFEVDGYQGIDHIASGDDMLLMEKIQKAFPDDIYYLKNKEVIVTTAVQKSWSSFINQRIRWSSKADQYKDKKLIWILALIYLFNLSLPIQLIIGFFYPPLFLILLVIIIAKIGIEMLFLFPVADFFNKKKALFYFPFLQLLHIMYIIIAGFLGKFSSYRWKDRTVK